VGGQANARGGWSIQELARLVFVFAASSIFDHCIKLIDILNELK
jgi:hypothetical protein